jgi:putative N6-adenine-specific DNA methylase
MLPSGVGLVEADAHGYHTSMHDAKPRTDDAPASRAAGKLEAALRLFGLAERVRGARAVDVGASRGGFTETLLVGGAAHVLAVDVGHGQLHPRLRADARVTSLEDTDWKTLPLGVAPGPFDVFVVDVSFVAARSMLRGLAFRLRPGAEGVVLVKPQFELPKGKARAARGDDPSARREAVSRFTAKAQALGFTVVAVADSPVHGASGTIEVLAHLRFEGRSAALPAPGERRTKAAAREHPPAAPPVASAAPLHWFAAAVPGAEDLVLAELATLPGVTGAARVVGGVEFEGDVEAGLRANLTSRIASRIWARVGEVDAREFAVLRRRAGALPWESFVPPGATIRVKASAARCRLRHTGALEETVALAVADRLARRGGASPRAKVGAAADTPPAEVLVLVRGVGDRFTLRIDASGELLHRRGWRPDGGAAPLRETLAAALLALAGWAPATPLVDPCCGSGTILIEAAQRALHHAPGLGRRFAIEAWPCADPEASRALRTALEAEAAAAARAPTPPLVGSDRSADAVARAERNATLAGVAGRVTFAAAELATLRAPRGHGRGLVLTNPPYGRRLGDAAAARETFAQLGWVLKERFARWQAAIVVPTPALAAALRMKPVGSHAIVHGGLRVRLLRYQL